MPGPMLIHRRRTGAIACVAATFLLLSTPAAASSDSGGAKGASAGDGAGSVYPPGTVLRDCETCPDMVVVPAGAFRMGDLSGGGDVDEGPVREVEIPRAFAVARFETTFAEWDACAADGVCRPGVSDIGLGRDRRPVMLVTWQDANEYVHWLSRRTGKPYRLPSEAEWEYAARAGSSTRYPWGDEVGRGRANCEECGGDWNGRRTSPVGSFPGNAFGVHDMVGNVYEWVADCGRESYAGAPSDGSAWESGDGTCKWRMMRGGVLVQPPAGEPAGQPGAGPGRLPRHPRRVSRRAKPRLRPGSPLGRSVPQRRYLPGGHTVTGARARHARAAPGRLPPAPAAPATTTTPHGPTPPDEPASALATPSA